MNWALSLFCVSFAWILLFEYVYSRFYAAKRPPLPVGYILFFFMLAYWGSSGYLGYSALRGILPPEERLLVLLASPFGVAAGVWLASSLMQRAQNVSRRLRGESALPVAGIRIFPPRPGGENKAQ